MLAVAPSTTWIVPLPKFTTVMVDTVSSVLVIVSLTHAEEAIPAAINSESQSSIECGLILVYLKIWHGDVISRKHTEVKYKKKEVIIHIRRLKTQDNVR